MNLSLLLNGFEETRTLTYTSVHDKNNPLKLQVHSIDSKAGRNAMRDMKVEIWELMKDEENLVETDDTKTLKPEHLNRISIDYISKLAESWDGVIDDKNKKVKFDRQLLKQAIETNNDLGIAIDTFSKDVEGNFQAV